MALDSKEICEILDFWHEVEVLTPFEIRRDMLSSEAYLHDSDEDTFVYRWDVAQPSGATDFDNEINIIPKKNDQSVYMKVFTVLLGVMDTDKYIKKIVQILRAENRGFNRDEFDMRYSETATQGQICLASFKVNHFGKVLPYSFTPSYALCWLTQKRLDSKYGSKDVQVEATLQDLLDEFYRSCFSALRSIRSVDANLKNTKVIYDVEYTKMKKGERKFKDLRSADELKVTSDFINSVCKHLCDLTGIKSSYAVCVCEKLLKSPKFIPDDFLNSPFVPVLQAMSDTVREGNANNLLSSSLKQFFSTACNNPEKKDILKKPQYLYEIINPQAFNYGRWPSPLSHQLACLQQLAVSRIRQAEAPNPIVSVNGPPGTGKTTLFREVIADIIVNRADTLVKIENIREEELFDSMNDRFNGDVKVLKKQYSQDFAVVVASHTNKAVENITKEFPLQFGFEGVDVDQVDYFGSLAKRLLENDKAWGMISVALGKATNWARAYEIFFGRPDHKKTYLSIAFEEEIEKYGGFTAMCEAWEEEKLLFKSLHKQVKSMLKAKSLKFEEDVACAHVKKRPKRSRKAMTVLDYELKPSSLYFNFSKEGNIDRHLDPLYTDKDLDKARTELFLSALKLHKLTILIHSERFLTAIEQSFRALMSVGNTGITATRYLDTFAFFCPVISTTFASSPYRFAKFSKGSIPWVFVDEASQVTPQSAVLLMQKAKRFIVMGDPKQLEPVVPLPRIITEMLTHRNSALEQWSPHNVSLQTLCDGTQNYGAWIGEENGGVWSGFPLRAHRRCFAPMFDISNSLSYAGQMVLANELRDKERRKEFVPSFWLNVVPDEPSDSNAVIEETEAVGLILQYILRTQLARPRRIDPDKVKTIMICSPFRAQIKQLRAYLKRLSIPKNNFFKISKVGTVHTMQGQQASIMIFVLGSRTGDVGKGARLWATEPPNLVNVAVTRGVETLIVVGNYEDWSDIGATGEITYQLKRSGLGVINQLPEPK